MKRMTRCTVCVFLLSFFSSVSTMLAQADSHEVLGSKNTFGVMVEYSNDSSHIILGDAENVKLGAVGIEYQRRLIANRHLVWSYAMEFRPAIVLSDPTITYKAVYTLPTPSTITSKPELVSRCVSFTETFNEQLPGPPVTTYAGTEYGICGRQSTYAQGFSPFGFRVNLRPTRRLQPTFSSLEGYIFSTQPLPVSNAGSFNFDFEIGAGLEYFRSERTSIRAEYVVQHFSNHDTANANPGVDNGIFKVTYSFGR
jgi:hypothetical protein